jgi:hypothetical protein
MNDHQGRFPVTPQVPKPYPEEPINSRQFQAFGSRTMQDSELLPSGDIFQPEFSRGLEDRHERAEQDKKPFLTA